MLLSDLSVYDFWHAISRSNPTLTLSNSWLSWWESLVPIADLIVAAGSALKELLTDADPYTIQLVFLAYVALSATYLQRQVYSSRRNNIQLLGSQQMDVKVQEDFSDAAASLGRRYLLVYGLVMGSDWLQGPYLYALYREQYNNPERLVAILFVTGFISAGLAAPFVGIWADRYGRKRLCLTFCVTYAAACLCKLVSFYPLLLFGRVFGGISTAILFSTFEAWLISSATSLSLPQSDLSTIMARATLLNGLVATTAGVVSNELVKHTGTFKSPFIMAAVVLVLSWIVIKVVWTENYGDIQNPVGTNTTSQETRMGEVWHVLRSDSQLLVLGLVQTCFEGSMYVFVFVWVPSLQEASTSASLPLGYIFSSFMISMVLGSLLYTFITNQLLPSSTFKSVTAPPTPALEFPLPHPSESLPPSLSSHSTPSMDVSASNPGITPAFPSPQAKSLVVYTRLSSFICLVSGLSLACSIFSSGVISRFWSFCVFEGCVGMYYPVQGMLRSILVPDEHRATVRHFNFDVHGTHFLCICHDRYLRCSVFH
ncbi:hypothetical protein AX15_006173 [Amanita polypyramis BW_CC]|nr:hypothetical protein AX15_006173 [Amanita polypyramis BW_CC]